jgi:molybdopterin-guanine dinucleotide biosynthesis protein A
MPDNDLSILILAGGNSSRLGTDKAWLPAGGQALVERLAWRVLPLAGEILFSAKQPERFRALAASLPIPAQVITDIYPGAGPLAGLHAGLRTAGHDLVLVLATDMPLVNLTLLAYLVGLAEGVDVVMPWVAKRRHEKTDRGQADTRRRRGEEKEEEGQRRGPPETEVGREGLAREPLHALYRRSCLPAIEAWLAAGQRQVIGFLPDVRVRDVLPAEISPLDPNFLSFLNVNTPEEWEQARKLL